MQSISFPERGVNGEFYVFVKVSEGVAEADEGFEEVVVAVVERRVDLPANGLVSDAVLEEPVSDLVAFGEVFRRCEREELLDGKRTVVPALRTRNKVGELEEPGRH